MTTSVAHKSRETSRSMVTTPARSELMSRVGQKDTPPEIRVRQLLHDAGHRYSTGACDLPGSPDIVSRSSRWAIFVHGCFWHAHQGCSKWRLPKRNRDSWREKFAANRARDARVVRELQELGFKVLTVWECELEHELALTRRLVEFLEPVYQEEGQHFRISARGHWLTRTVVTADHAFTRIIPLDPEDEPASNKDGKDLSDLWDRSLLTSSEWFAPKEFSGPKVRIVDLFSGCGGLSLGAREACHALGRSFVPLLAVDNDPQALAVYSENFSPASARAADIVDLLDGELGTKPSPSERELVKQLEDVDIVLAGPPCQGHSDLNNHSRRNDPRNALYSRVGRFVELVRPEHVLIENVPTIVHAEDPAMDETLELLRGLGYEVAEDTVDLLEIGVPQTRRRHVVVASRSRSVSISEIVEKHATGIRDLWWAIRDLEDTSDSFLDRSSNLHPANQERIAHLFEKDLWDLPNELRPECHQDGNHSYKSMYGRLRWDEPAQTITSGYGSPGQGRYIHPSRKRVLTPHEAARLQFFPDSFSFEKVETRTALANMIGNAVPMKLSYVLCLELLQG